MPASMFSLRNGQWCAFRPTALSVACGAHGEKEQPAAFLLKAIGDEYHRTPGGLVVGIFMKGGWQQAAVSQAAGEEAPRVWIPDRIVPAQKDTGLSFEWGGGHTLGFDPRTVEEITPLDYLLPEHLAMLPAGRVAHLLEGER